jgi:DNA-binding transcriptional MerR regulator
MRTRRPKLFPEAWIDPATLFTRQEIAERTGQTDDVLSFWSKRSLLVPAEGGGGQGRHLRYAHPQVSIAAIYTVFRDHFGANLSTLQSLADLLQGAVKAFAACPLHPSDWSKAASLGQELHDFRNGTPVMVRAHDYDDPGYEDLPIDEQMRRQPATNEAEIIAARWEFSERSPAGAIIKLAETLGPGHETDAVVAQALIGGVLDPVYFNDPSWLMHRTNDRWEILEAIDGLNFEAINSKSLGPALFVPIGKILRGVWGIPAYRELRNTRFAREMQDVLDKHGIVAVASPSVKEDYYVAIDAPEATWEIIAPLAEEAVSYYELRDPAHPEGAEA